MAKYKLTEEYDDILEQLLARESELKYITDNGVAVGIVASETEKKKGGNLVYADCRKVSEMYRLFTPFDFIITVYEPNCMHLSPNQMKVLVFHELLHVGAERTDKDEVKLSIRAHDFEDFRIIVKRFGEDWNM